MRLRQPTMQKVGAMKAFPVSSSRTVLNKFSRLRPVCRIASGWAEAAGGRTASAQPPIVSPLVSEWVKMATATRRSQGHRRRLERGLEPRIRNMNGSARVLRKNPPEAITRPATRGANDGSTRVPNEDSAFRRHDRRHRQRGVGAAVRRPARCDRASGSGRERLVAPLALASSLALASLASLVIDVERRAKRTKPPPLPLVSSPMSRARARARRDRNGS